MKERIKKQKNKVANDVNQVCLFRKIFCGMPLKLILMNLDEHISFMHSWANQFYTAKFWQMKGDYLQFYRYYKSLQNANEEIVLIAYLDHIPIAQLEIYPVIKSVLAEHFEAGSADVGFHLLMAPYREILNEIGEKAKGISLAVLQCMLEYLFFITRAENVLVEPDCENKNACLLAEKSGFAFLKKIKLPDKTAALYLYKRDEFLKLNPQLHMNNQLNLFADKFKL